MAWASMPAREDQLGAEEHGPAVPPGGDDRDDRRGDRVGDREQGDELPGDRHRDVQVGGDRREQAGEHESVGAHGEGSEGQHREHRRKVR
nr:hypothetical protein GCM10020241_33360 [Streptoalloteichus tenebrarius]